MNILYVMNIFGPKLYQSKSMKNKKETSKKSYMCHFWMKIQVKNGNGVRKDNPPIF